MNDETRYRAAQFLFERTVSEMLDRYFSVSVDFSDREILTASNAAFEAALSTLSAMNAASMSGALPGDVGIDLWVEAR